MSTHYFRMLGRKLFIAKSHQTNSQPTIILSRKAAVKYDEILWQQIQIQLNRE